MDHPILLAGVGGFIVDILQLMELAKVPKEQRPDLKDWLYWVQYIAYPFFGALLAYAYLATGLILSPLIALHVGLSAPLVFRQAIKSNPFSTSSINPGDGA